MRIRPATVSRLLFFVLFFTAVSAQAAWKVALWIPPWSSQALTSIQTNLGSFQESNPVWYAWNADGAIVPNWNAESESWRAAMTGTEILPTVQNVIGGSFAQSKVEAMLSTAASRAAHEDAIVALVNAKAFDGIDIDYESIPTSSRANFTAFVQSLAAKLHASGKKLSVTVHPKTSDSQNWTGPGAQDWVAIGAAADTVRIMVYDYSWSTSAPGPITPLNWLDAVTTYAESVIPPSKIRIGLPFYGYDWSGSTGKGVSYAAAMATAAQNNATITRDVNGEATFQYPNHTVYFQDAVSYSRKLDVLKQKHPGIGGIVHWAAGQEDPAIWDVIRGSGAPTGGSGGQAATGDFAIAVAGQLEVRQGSSVDAAVQLTAINGFTSTGSVTAQALTSSFAGTVTLSGSTISAASPVTLTVQPGSTPAGIYQLLVRVVSGSITREQQVVVTVLATRSKRRTVR